MERLRCQLLFPSISDQLSVGSCLRRPRDESRCHQLQGSGQWTGKDQPACTPVAKTVVPPWDPQFVPQVEHCAGIRTHRERSMTCSRALRPAPVSIAKTGWGGFLLQAARRNWLCPGPERRLPGTCHDAEPRGAAAFSESEVRSDSVPFHEGRPPNCESQNGDEKWNLGALFLIKALFQARQPLLAHEN